MAARAKVIESGREADGGHPCFAKGSDLKYSYAGGLVWVGEWVGGWVGGGKLPGDWVGRRWLKWVDRLGLCEV